MNRNRLTALVVAGIVLAMTGAAFAAVPLYDAFCRLTGFGGATRTAEAALTQVLDRRIEVRFDANIAPDLAVEFEPTQRSQSLRIGETGLAFFRIKNLSEQAVVARATYNVTPHLAGSYFYKTECFCFNDRVLAAGEEAELPLIYHVSPDLVADRDVGNIETLTLSYTFFRAADQSAAASSS
jgi:cytochrome c oxidase assembly protein subunit 11